MQLSASTAGEPSSGVTNGRCVPKGHCSHSPSSLGRGVNPSPQTHWNTMRALCPFGEVYCVQEESTNGWAVGEKVESSRSGGERFSLEKYCSARRRNVTDTRNRLIDRIVDGIELRFGTAALVKIS